MRPGANRELRDGLATSISAAANNKNGSAHAPLTHPPRTWRRGPSTSLSRARRDFGLRVKEQPQTMHAGPEGRVERSSAVQRDYRAQPIRAQRVDPDDVASAARRRHRGRDGCIRKGQRSRCGPTSTLSTTRSHGRRWLTSGGDACGGCALRRFQPDGRRLPPEPARNGRRAPRRKVPFKPRAREQGFNSVLLATHRQNFLVPPRRPRSSPARRAGAEPLAPGVAHDAGAGEHEPGRDWAAGSGARRSRSPSPCEGGSCLARLAAGQANIDEQQPRAR